MCRLLCIGIVVACCLKFGLLLDDISDLGINFLQGFVEVSVHVLNHSQNILAGIYANGWEGKLALTQ